MALGKASVDPGTGTDVAEEGEQAGPAPALKATADPTTADPATASPTTANPTTPQRREPAEQLFAAQVVYRLDRRGLAEDWLVAPADTLRLAMESVLLTSGGDLRPLLATERLALTDLSLLQLSLGYSVGGDLELLAEALLLPKQPIASDALAWQGATLGVRVALQPHVAATLLLRGGPTIDAEGLWTDGRLTLDARYEAHRYLRFAASAGAAGTALRPEDTWMGLVELLAAGDVILHAEGKIGVDVGVAFAFPVWRHAGAGQALDPQTRVDAHASIVLAMATTWDIWLSLAVIDRGQLDIPASILPILDGGFDQQQLSVGIAYRSEGQDPDLRP